MGWSAAGSTTITLDLITVVSIPERVWGGLEHLSQAMLPGLDDVSIPERVWGGLEPAIPTLKASLVDVSIPERVWGGLELQLTLVPIAQ